MPRQPTGQVVEKKTARRGKVYALRFPAYGRRQYVTLGPATDGWTRRTAEAELERVLAAVKLGIWRPPDRGDVEEEEAPSVPTFHTFASEWFASRRGELRPNTQLDYEWQLTHHLLPFFAAFRLDEIDVRLVDRYRHAKVSEGRLSATSVNKTLTRLAQILDVAVEYELIARNPARGRNRKLRASKPRTVWLDTPEQIDALLSAAGELDREAHVGRRHVGRRALLSTLVFAGLRIGELCALRWRDVDLARGRLHVHDSKTAAGVRTIELLPVLREELSTYKAGRRRCAPDALVFATSSGAQLGRDNVRNRVLALSVKRANERLAEADLVPLPEGLTLHKLRHTFASLLVALGEDPGHAMDQLGHTDPAFTLRVYRHAMRRDPGEKDRLRALVGADLAAGTGTGARTEALTAPLPIFPPKAETAS